MHQIAQICTYIFKKFPGGNTPGHQNQGGVKHPPQNPPDQRAPTVPLFGAFTVAALDGEIFETTGNSLCLVIVWSTCCTYIVLYECAVCDCNRILFDRAYLFLVHIFAVYKFVLLHQVICSTAVSVTAQNKVVLGRSSNRNRKPSTLATIEHNRNRNISKAKCDFDHTLFRCCTIFMVHYQLEPSHACVEG